MASNILTLNFDGLGPVTFQYHPAALGTSISSNSTNTRGLDRTITYVAPPETTNQTISITGYFTALIPAADEFGALGRSLGAAASTTAVAASIGGGKVLDIIDAAVSTVSLVAGSIDLVGGIIKGNNIPASPLTLSNDSINRLIFLNHALKESIPCTLNWDIDNKINDGQQYILTQMDISTERIQEESGNSMEIRVDLRLIKYGTRVEVE